MRPFSHMMTLLAVTMLAVSCINEEPNYLGQKPEPIDPNAKGFLAAGAMEIKVIYDTETLPDQTRAATGHAETLPADYTIELLDAQGQSVEGMKMSYGEWLEKFSAAEGGSVELPVGSYTLKAYSTANIPDMAWEQPEYGTSKEFTITKQNTTQLGELVCTLSNIKVTMLYSVDLSDMLDATTSSEISLGTTKATFSKTEIRAAYFRATEKSNTLNFLLTGKFADTGKDVSLSKAVTNVKSGQWRKIQLVIEHAADGDVKFSIIIENFELDEEVVVNASETLTEELINEENIEDPDAPQIVWKEHDITVPFQLTREALDTENFDFNVTSKYGVQSFIITLGSSNEAFMQSLVDMSIPTSFDLCTTTEGPVYTIFHDWFHFPMGDEAIGKHALNFNIGGQMEMLYEFSGTHTFGLTITDSEGLTTTRTLTITVEKGPEVEWVGYDINKAETLFNGMEVKVNIAATAGIKSFVVTIESQELWTLLDKVNVPGLKSPFDLCTVTGAEAEFLSGTVGFPTGGDVLNKTAISFDITDFVPALLSIEDPTGAAIEFNFKLEITDNNNETTVRTLQLRKAATSK